MINRDLMHNPNFKADDLRRRLAQWQATLATHFSLFFEKILKRSARIRGTLAAAGSFFLDGDAHRVEGAVVALVFGRNPLFNRLIAFETAGGIEVLALLAGVQFEAAFRTLAHRLGKCLKHSPALRAA